MWDLTHRATLNIRRNWKFYNKKSRPQTVWPVRRQKFKTRTYGIHVHPRADQYVTIKHKVNFINFSVKFSIQETSSRCTEVNVAMCRFIFTQPEYVYSFLSTQLQSTLFKYNYYVLLVVVGPAGRPAHDQQHCYHQAPTVNQRLRLQFLQLLMMVMRMPETC